MTAGQTIVLVAGLLAAFWLAVTVAVNTWRRPPGPAGRHRSPATRPVSRRERAADRDDGPPLPRATRQQLRDAGR